MLVIVVGIIVMLAMLDRALRLGRLQVLMLNTRNKFLALRDTLQRAALSGAVDAHAPLFRYFDAVLSTTPQELSKQMHLHRVFAIETFADDASEVFDSFKAELRKPTNSRYGSIYDGTSKCMREFTEQRHRVLVHILKWLAGFVEQRRRAELVKKFKEQEIKAALRTAGAARKQPAEQYC